jgi:hypothetical protein
MPESWGRHPPGVNAEAFQIEPLPTRVAQRCSLAPGAHGPKRQRIVTRRTEVKLMLSAAVVDWITAGSQMYSPGLTIRAK